ncbi:retrovirus-related Pol polyprotein from type-1 retrotransposable element R2 [Caerostris extrusa]|uniref:Retrovirus-related Pol polyprotein from type-1 retrotransposable element R2 n=1 Tax=Caerostris extrusa TaxID=172846 RepID=A0AAV4XWX7_CAEEX|nr:retrovirus-related Pol polyprotein from type-1 retrotransposable element R2 [Caerostris extrusa]
MRAFRSCENTAPGSDRITYHHWRSLDPKATVLTKFLIAVCKFNSSQRNGRSPPPSSFQNLGTCKLEANCSGQHCLQIFHEVPHCKTTKLVPKYDVLSPCQKGFTPFDGVLEHNFILQRRIEKAISSKSHLCVAFLDVSNAFGSLPHSAIRDCLAAIGDGDTFLNLVMDAYSNCFTSILTNGTRTDLIPISCGVKQGFPLSGLLFNLCIDLVLRTIQGDAADHRVLAFAEDLVFLADSQVHLQNDLNHVHDLLQQISLCLNPSKCKTLHICGGLPAGVRGTSFEINGRPIPRMEEFDSTRFLENPSVSMPAQTILILMIFAHLQGRTVAATGSVAPIKTVKLRIHTEPSDSDLGVSGEIEGRFATSQTNCLTPGRLQDPRQEGRIATSSNKLSNTWTVARSASRRLNIEWTFVDGVFLKLRNKNSQGKVLKFVSLSPASSHFVADGAYTRFADWRFTHKARLNLVPLNGCQPWKTGDDKMCRRCNQWSETLPHVINHCGIHSQACQLRHNAIVERVLKAISRKASILSVNQTNQLAARLRCPCWKESVYCGCDLPI